MGVKQHLRTFSMLLIWNLCLSSEDEYKNTTIINLLDRNINLDKTTLNSVTIDDFTTINNVTDRNESDVEFGRLIDSAEDLTDYVNGTEEPCVGDPEFCNMTRDDYIEMLNDYIFPQPYEWVLIATHAIVFIIGLIGNALVCVAVYRNHSMRTVTNYFIVNLAVADFMVILICLPPTVLWDVTETWFFGTAMCRIVLYFQVRFKILIVNFLLGCCGVHCGHKNFLVSVIYHFSGLSPEKSYFYIEVNR